MTQHQYYWSGDTVNPVIEQDYYGQISQTVNRAKPLEWLKEDEINKPYLMKYTVAVFKIKLKSPSKN